MSGFERADFERFVEFLRREAAGYHAPPETPRDVMWQAITEVTDPGVELLPLEQVDEELATAAAGYHPPPEPPREEMWDRILGAWQLRRSASGEARTAGLEPLAPVRWEDPAAEPAGAPEITPVPRARPARRSALAGLAIAASLILAFALGRGTAPVDIDSGPEIASTNEPAPGPLRDDPRTAALLDDGTSVSEPGPARPDPLRTGTGIAVATHGREQASLERGTEAGSADRGREVGTGQPPAVRPGGGQTATRYLLAQHFERADALLSSFEAEGPDPSLSGAVASWADGLLAETRLLLLLPEERRDPVATRLLEELELILTQIALLDTESSSAERRLIRDALEGTTGRIRAASERNGTLGTAGT